MCLRLGRSLYLGNNFQPQLKEIQAMQTAKHITQLTSISVSRLMMAAAISSSLLLSPSVKAEYTMTPDGNYVSGRSYTMTPDGSYVGGSSYSMTPNGSYVGGNTSTMTPDGSYVGGSRSTMTPDGSYVGGSGYQMTPDGRYIGR